jgi:hypothetical protein
MNRPFRLAPLFLLLVPLAARADEPPYLDFVHGLRERHYADLALEYLHKLQERKDLPADVAARLPLEIARTQLDRAGDTPDLGQRLVLYAEARKQFETFLAKNSTSPLANQARFDLASVAVRQGRTQLSRALRDEEPTSRAAEAAKARQLLDDAGKQLQGVVPLLEQQVKTYPDAVTATQKAEKRELEDSLYQARIDVALNLYDQARTYVDDKQDSLAARGKLIEQADQALRKAMPDDERQPLHWVAEAWLGRLADEAGRPVDARKQLAEVIAQTGPFAAAGRRLARYFRMLVIKEAGDPTIKDKWKEIRDEAARWVRDYPAYLNTPEGFGVRFALAEACIQIGVDQKTRAAKLPYYNEAKAVCKDLEEVENDYQARARDIKIKIIKEEGGLKAEVKTLPTFDDCYVRAQYEGSVLEQDKEDGKALTAEQREQHRKTLVQALVRGLDLAGRQRQKVPQADLYNAKAALAFAYMTSGDLRAAARVGEELARVPTRPAPSGRAAIYALHSLAQLVADPEKAQVSPEEARAYRDRLRNLAEFAKRNWPNDAPADVARHELGVLDIREGNYAAAVSQLSGIRPGYGGAIMAHYQLAMAALEAQKNKAAPVGADKRPFERQAQEALEKMPDLPPGADEGTNYTYVMAKVQLANLYYKEKKYDAMAALAEPLLQRLPSLKFPTEKLTDDARSGLSLVSLYAKYGKAEQDYNAGRHEAVVKLLEPLLPEAEKLPELRTKPDLAWALFSLLMRSDIQSGKLDEAQKVLDVLMALAAANELGGGANQVLTQVAQLIKGQVHEVERKAPDRLPKLKDAFSKFLDRLTAQQEKKKALTPEVLLLLSNCYSALDNHKRAADMLKAYPEPKDGAPQKDRDVCQVIQVMYLRELRLDKQLDEAKKKYQELAKTPWGPRNLELQKEKYFLLMEDGAYYQAARGFDGLVKALVSKLTVPGMKDQYLECYYWLVVCLYKHSQGLKEDRRQAALKSVANFIVSLENRWPDFGTEASKARFQELLEKEAPLKEAYEALKGGKAQAGGTGNGKPR